MSPTPSSWRVKDPRKNKLSITTSSQIIFHGNESTTKINGQIDMGQMEGDQQRVEERK